VKVIAVIPAHNEQASVGRTVRSLRVQTVRVNRVLVVSDNSTDRTVAVARKAGARTMVTRGNTSRKAGALNQALATLRLSPEDFVLVMDADTELVPTFVERALEDLRDPLVGAVGAVFRGQKPHGYLQFMQRLEWARYAEQIARTGKTFVLSGTAALIRWAALQSVRDAHGHFYDPHSITEDSRFTLDLKRLGWRVTSPVDCRATTEMMPTVRLLFLQRRRWYLGALQNVTACGLDRVTAPYWRQQVMLTVSVALMATYLVLTTIAVLAGGFRVDPFWLAVGLVFALERVVTVWDEGWKARLTAAAVLFELTYALILQAAFLAAFVQHARRQEGTWHHVTQGA
jgi:cellulose synthase/poly-beta-1,6-N-acetylglucosamine synthase-like glycosyltransferase